MAIIVAVYVVFGGIRGVMYTDALQGTIMFFGMAFLLIATYWLLGGVVNANELLTGMAVNGSCQGSCNWCNWMDIHAHTWAVLSGGPL